MSPLWVNKRNPDIRFDSDSRTLYWRESDTVMRAMRFDATP